MNVLHARGLAPVIGHRPGRRAALASMVALGALIACTAPTGGPASAPAGAGSSATTPLTASAAPGSTGSPLAAPPTASPASATAHPGPRPQVRIAYPSRVPTLGIVAVMKERGFLDEYGVDAELHTITSPLSVTAMLSGEVDFNLVGAEPIISANLQGGDTVLLSCGTTSPIWWVVGKSAIQRPQDLKGLRVANNRQGSNLYEVFQLGLEKWGLSPGDVTMVTVEGDPQKLLALQNDAADATVVNSPNHLQAIEMGFRAIADLGELGIEWPSSCIATTRRYAADQPAAARAVVQAYIAAAHWMRRNKEPAIDLLMAFSGSDNRAIVEEGYNTYQKYLPAVPAPSRSGIQTVLRAVFTDHAATASPDQFVDDRFVRELEAAGFIAQVAQP
jgi:NitT/TauT family transport system substrate-binding protein